MKNLIVTLFVGLISLGSFAQEKIAKIEFKTDVIKKLQLKKVLMALEFLNSQTLVMHH